MNLESLSLVQAASDIRNGKLSPVEYIQALFTRIERVEPQIEAWVTLNRDAAFVEARACEAEARQKKFRGHLHGVPVGVKDIFHTKGLRTTAGSRFFENFAPESDARCVEQLKKAGAIILGKCVTTEFATFDPGPTKNPWNTAHTPGGSSSGSAAAVAAEMCPGATGSQTVASIGRPAAFCGVAGLMPTQQRISREGVFPVSWSLDHIGAFGRTAADVEMMLAGMTELPVTRFRTPNRIRFGVIHDFFRARATEEARTLMDGIVKKLADAKHQINEVRLPPIFDIATPSLMTIMRSEIGSAHEGLHRENSARYGKRLRALVETGMLIDAGAYLRALRIRRLFQQEMRVCFKSADVLITPGALGPAPQGLAYTGDPVLSGPWTLADFPTLTIPTSLASNGMPVGIQVTAPPMQDSLLLSIGKAMEEVIEFRSRPPI